MNRASYRDFVFFLTAVGAAILANGCGGGSGSGGGPQPPAQISVTISPTTASVPINTTQQFTDTVTGTSNTAVTWSVNAVVGGNSTVGTISNTGLYTAPGTVPSPATVMVAVTSQADTSKSASAAVTITAPSPPGMRNVSVTAGTTTSGVDIAVQQLNPTLVLTAVGILNPDGSGSAGATGIEISRTTPPASGKIFVVGQGVVPGTSYQITGPNPNDVQVNPPATTDFGTTKPPNPMPDVTLRISVSPTAVLGPRNIVATNAAGETSVLVGAFLITP